MAAVRRKKKKKNSQTALVPTETIVAVAATVRASADVTRTGIAMAIASATEVIVIIDATSATGNPSSGTERPRRKTLKLLSSRVRPPIPVSSPSARDDDAVDVAASDSRKALQRKPLTMLQMKKPLPPVRRAIRRAIEEDPPTSVTRGGDAVSDAAWKISRHRRSKPSLRPQQ